MIFQMIFTCIKHADIRHFIVVFRLVYYTSGSRIPLKNHVYNPGNTFTKIKTYDILAVCSTF